MNQPGLGGYNPHDVKADATWQKCTAINWTKVAGEPTMEGKLSLPSVQMTGMMWGCRDVGMGSDSNPLEIRPHRFGGEGVLIGVQIATLNAQ